MRAHPIMSFKDTTRGSKRSRPNKQRLDSSDICGSSFRIVLINQTLPSEPHEPIRVELIRAQAATAAIGTAGYS